jgi:hypothetical protein
MLANLRALFGVIIDIVRLRSGPENLPSSNLLLGCVVALSAVGTALAASQVATEQQARWPLELVVGVVTTLVFYQVALALVRKRERFVQSMTALFAVRALFTPALIPIMSAIKTSIDATKSAPAALSLIALALFIWLLIVEVRIMRSTFGWPTAGAVALVLTQEFAGVIVFSVLFALLPKPG